MSEAPATGLAATVLLPTTGERVELLRLSLPTVLAQTVRNLEVFVLGDGVADSTRTWLKEVADRDPRVRLFDHPKHARRGEPHRHAALAEARGRIACYVTDRDLLLPHHVEVMAGLLEGADLAHTLPVGIRPDGGLDLRRALELAASDPLPVVRRANIPLSFAGHTLAMYRRLPHGWRETPAGMPTDRYMWEQFLRHPGCRIARGERPTVLYFKRGSHPDGWTIANRLPELRAWSERLATPGFPAAFERRVRRQWQPRRAWSRLARALERGLARTRGGSRGAPASAHRDLESYAIQRHLRLDVFWNAPARRPGATLRAHDRVVLRLEGAGRERAAEQARRARVALVRELPDRLAGSRVRRVRETPLDAAKLAEAAAWMERRMRELARERADQ